MRCPLAQMPPPSLRIRAVSLTLVVLPSNKRNIDRVAFVADARTRENIRIRVEGARDRAESLRRRASCGLTHGYDFRCQKHS